MQSGATRLDSNISTGIAVPRTDWISSFQHFSLLHAFEALIPRAVRLGPESSKIAAVRVCMHACVHACMYACKTRVRGEEIISSLERARESEGEGGGRGKERERADASSSLRGNASSRIGFTAPGHSFQPVPLLASSAPHSNDFSNSVSFHDSHRVETCSDPGIETRRERIFRNTRSDFNVGETWKSFFEN